MDEDRDWKTHYYNSIVCRRLPNIVLVMVLISHYVSCTHVSIDNDRSSISTPLHYLKNWSVESCPLDEPVLKSEAEYVENDPLSLIYDTVVLLWEHERIVAIPETREETVPVIIPNDDKSGVLQLSVLFLIASTVVITLWFPATYMSFSTKSSAVWTIGTLSIVCNFTGWCVCMLIYTQGPLRKMSLCLSMHLTMQLLDSFGAFVLCSDATLPIYMPIIVSNGIRVGQGILLWYIAQSTGSISTFDTTEFYMDHMWALGICGVFKSLVLSPIIILLEMTSFSRLIR